MGKLRQNLTNIVNELCAATHDLHIDVFHMYYLIQEYCIKTNTLHNPRINDYMIDNGVLVINGKHIDRVIPLIRPFNTYSDESYYYEGKCIHDTDI